MYRIVNTRMFYSRQRRSEREEGGTPSLCLAETPRPHPSRSHLISTNPTALEVWKMTRGDRKQISVSEFQINVKELIGDRLFSYVLAPIQGKLIGCPWHLQIKQKACCCCQIVSMQTYQHRLQGWGDSDEKV